MTDLRAAREQAYWEHWRKSLREDPRGGLPAFLDALEAIDQAHAVTVLGPGAVPIADLTEEELADLRARFDAAKDRPIKILPPEPRAPTDDEISEWIGAHADKFAAWVREQVRIHGGLERAFGPAATAEPKPARAARKPRGGTAT